MGSLSAQAPAEESSEDILARWKQALMVERRKRDRRLAGAMPEQERLEQERLEQERLARLEQQELLEQLLLEFERSLQNRLEQDRLERLEQDFPEQQRLDQELELIELVVARADHDRQRVQQDEERAQQELKELMDDAERRDRPDPRLLRARGAYG